MMSMRRVTIVAVTTLALMGAVGICSATLLLNANPNYITIPVGGTNYTTIMIEDTLNSSYTVGTLPIPTYKIAYNINNPNVTASLSGPFYDPNFTLPVPGYTTTTPFGTKGSIQWYGVNGTKYYFKLTFTSTTANQKFSAAISAATVNITTAPFSFTLNLNGTTVAGVVLPQLPTVILMSLGLLGVGIMTIRRRN